MTTRTFSTWTRQTSTCHCLCQLSVAPLAEIAIFAYFSSSRKNNFSKRFALLFPTLPLAILAFGATLALVVSSPIMSPYQGPINVPVVVHQGPGAITPATSEFSSPGDFTPSRHRPAAPFNTLRRPSLSTFHGGQQNAETVPAQLVDVPLDDEIESGAPIRNEEAPIQNGN